MAMVPVHAFCVESGTCPAQVRSCVLLVVLYRGSPITARFVSLPQVSTCGNECWANEPCRLRTLDHTGGTRRMCGANRCMKEGRQGPACLLESLTMAEDGGNVSWTCPSGVGMRLPNGGMRPVIGWLDERLGQRASSTSVSASCPLNKKQSLAGKTTSRCI
jgi:hypothetical protein